jgi:hypothetical protein
MQVQLHHYDLTSQHPDSGAPVDVPSCRVVSCCDGITVDVFLPWSLKPRFRVLHASDQIPSVSRVSAS